MPPAVEAAGSFDVVALVPVLRSRRFDTVLGELTFDSKGDIEQTAFVLYQWSRGDYRQVASP